MFPFSLLQSLAITTAISLSLLKQETCSQKQFSNRHSDSLMKDLPTFAWRP
jgi:hypothetical protein